MRIHIAVESLKLGVQKPSGVNYLLTFFSFCLPLNCVSYSRAVFFSFLSFSVLRVLAFVLGVSLRLISFINVPFSQSSEAWRKWIVFSRVPRDLFLNLLLWQCLWDFFTCFYGSHVKLSMNFSKYPSFRDVGDGIVPPES